MHRIETPVGAVEAELHGDGSVTVYNVQAYRYRTAVPLDVPGYGRMHGDIAWGGNWFFLVADHGQSLEFANVEALTEASWVICGALEANGITGEGGALIDHIELFAEPDSADYDSRNFVLCPGKAYDRSPCGTSTSAKVACLAADGLLAPGQHHRQRIRGELCARAGAARGAGEAEHLRHGACERAGASDFPGSRSVCLRYSSVMGATRTAPDVIVVGTGIVGAACAHELAASGANVLVLERAVVGGGATAAGMGHLVVMDDTPVEFALSAWLRQLWNELAPRLDARHAFVRCGTLWVAEDDEEYALAQTRQRSLERDGVACTMLDASRRGCLRSR